MEVMAGVIAAASHNGAARRVVPFVEDHEAA